MNIRLFHAKIRPGKQSEFKKIVQMLSRPHLHSKHGMIAFYPSQPIRKNCDEVLLITIWKDLADFERRGTDEWARAILPDEALQLLEEYHVDGYKAYSFMDQAPKPLFQNL